MKTLAAISDAETSGCTISASLYSPNISRVERKLPLRIVGSSGIQVNHRKRWNGIPLTRNDRDLAPKVRKANLGDVEPIDDYFALTRRDKAKER
jgi:hypothetical protein